MASLLTPRWFLAWLCLINVLLNMGTGLVPAVLSSLQRRYGYSTTALGALVSVGDFVGLLAALPIGYYGAHRHKPRWLSVGSVVAGAGLLLFAVPFFLTPKYRPANQSGSTISRVHGVEICVPGASDPGCPVGSAAGAGAMYALFLLGNIVMQVGSKPLISLAPAFLQETVEKHAFNMHLGAFMVSGIMGSAVGFALSGVLLSLWIDLGSPPAGLTDSDPAFIGAWWLGFAVAGLMALAAGVLGLRVWPKHLPNTEHVRAALAENKEVTNTQSSGFDRASFLGGLRAVLTNSVAVMNTIGSAFAGFVVSGFSAFMPLIFQLQFSTTAGTAALITGAILVPGGVGGTMLGGWLSKRWQLSGPGQAKLTAVVALLAAMSVSVLALHCQTPSLAGVNHAYQGDLATGMEPRGLITACNAACNCSTTDAFFPVCGSDGVSYFSPCFAGCNATGSPTDPSVPDVFHSCSCITTGPQPATATSGYCANSMCGKLPAAAILMTVAIAMIFTNNVPAMSVVMRCLPSVHVSSALSIMQVAWGLVGSFPGPLVLGKIIDSTCILQQQTCSTDGFACVLTNNTDASIKYAAYAVSGKVMCAISFGLSWWCYRRRTTKLLAAQAHSQHDESSRLLSHPPVMDDHAGRVEVQLSGTGAIGSVTAPAASLVPDSGTMGQRDRDALALAP